MNVSAKTEYACLAVMELAVKYSLGDPVRVRAIADLHGIPPHFLVQILLQLKGSGIVASTRGAAGGYQLVKPPAEITLAEVMQVIDGPPEEVTGNAAQQTPGSRVLLAVWNDVARVELETFSSITFADLVDRIECEAEQMYYI